MTPALEILRAGPGLTLQDRGRPGFLAQGLSRGGAVDPLALDEGAALLGDDPASTVLEMAGMGGAFRATGDLVIALTGAPMTATCDGERLHWHTAYRIAAGQVLDIGGVEAGLYGYLRLAGGIAAKPVLGARSTHLAAGIGQPLAAGDRLEAAGGPCNPKPGCIVDAADRFSGGEIAVLPGIQTGAFDADTRARFEATVFRKDSRFSRMGARLDGGGPGFAAAGHLDLTSEIIVPGDIQVVGDGAPYVLLAECQTTGGYPRIGTVISADLPRFAQAPVGAEIRFRMVTRDVALARRAAQAGRDLRVSPLLRDPRAMADLGTYQLISGATSGRDEG